MQIISEEKKEKEIQKSENQQRSKWKTKPTRNKQQRRTRGTTDKIETVLRKHNKKQTGKIFSIPKVKSKYKIIGFLSLSSYQKSYAGSTGEFP